MSKFSSLLQSKQEPFPPSDDTSQNEEEIKAENVASVPEPKGNQAKSPAEQHAPAVSQSAPAPLEGKVLNMEPPRGKKGNPEYNQVTIYLKKQTQNKAKIAMLQAQDERDFSELVEDLLTEWLVGKPV